MANKTEERGIIGSRFADIFKKRNLRYHTLAKMLGYKTKQALAHHLNTKDEKWAYYEVCRWCIVLNIKPEYILEGVFENDEQE